MSTRALVVGAGSIGRRHAQNLTALEVGEIAVCDPDAERVSEVAALIGAVQFAELQEALTRFEPSIVVVCSPPALHVEHALQALSSGAHLFIEKPVAADISSLTQLEARAAAAGSIVQVGYNLTFHPAVEQLKRLVDGGEIGRILWARAEFGQYLPDWRPWQDYRLSYTARRSLGGGIILDGSHEIGLLVHLLGRPTHVAAMAGTVSDLEVDVEDVASLLLRFPGGTLADVHLDFVQRTYSRSCRLAGSEGTVTWRLADGELVVERPQGEPEVSTHPPDAAATYVDELRHFLDCVVRAERPRVDLQFGVDVLRIAAAAAEAAATGRTQEPAWSS